MLFYDIIYLDQRFTMTYFLRIVMKNTAIPFLIPMELNDKSVRVVFSGCSALDQITDEATIRLIRYLFGQLQVIHEGKGDFNLREAFHNYNGDLWTNDIATLMCLLSLGYMAGVSAETTDPEELATLSDVHIVVNDPEMEPTVSPKDPLFSEWKKEYRAKNHF